MSNHPRSPSSPAPVRLAWSCILRHRVGKWRVRPGIDWHWEMDPVCPLAPFYSNPPPLFFFLPAICFSELDRFGQSDSRHCVAVGVNRMRGETHCHYVVTIRRSFSSCLFHSKCSSQLSGSVWLSLSAEALITCPALPGWWLPNAAVVWQRGSKPEQSVPGSGNGGIRHVDMLLQIVSDWYLGQIWTRGITEKTPGDLHLHILLLPSDVFESNHWHWQMQRR